MPRSILRLSLLLLALVAHRTSGFGAELGRLAPESSTFYAEIGQPQIILDRLLSPVLYERLQAIQAVADYYASPQYQQGRFVLGLLEAKLGTDWRAGLRQALGGGMALSFDATTQGAVVAVRGEPGGFLGKLHDTVLEFAEADLRNKGKPEGIPKVSHRGVTYWSMAPELHHALIRDPAGDVLIVSNQSDSLKSAIDRQVDMSAKSLLDTPEYQEAHKQVGEGKAAWGYANLNVIRGIPDVKKALEAKSNPLVEFLAGGILDAAERANVATAAVDWHGDELKLRLATPRDPSQTSARRQWYFAKSDLAPVVFKEPSQIGSIVFDRAFGEMWGLRDDLFDEQSNAGLAQADSGLGLFFSGRDFGPEVLGELKPRWQFVFARQSFAADQPQPAFKLPAFAVVVQMKNPDAFSRHLLMAFQNIVGIVNITGAQNGQPQFLVATENRGGATISSATYFVEDSTPKTNAPINYNFSPACARVGDRFIIGSTTQLTRQLVDASASPDGGTTDAAPWTAEDNTRLAIDLAQLTGVLEDNREVMISQNMLSQGSDRAAAEKNIGGLMATLALLKKASAAVQVEANALSVEISIVTDAALRGAGG